MSNSGMVRLSSVRITKEQKAALSKQPNQSKTVRDALAQYFNIQAAKDDMEFVERRLDSVIAPKIERLAKLEVKNLRLLGQIFFVLDSVLRKSATSELEYQKILEEASQKANLMIKDSDLYNLTQNMLKTE